MTTAPPPLLSNQPLPSNPYSQESHPEWHNAYNEALRYQDVDPMRGRLLGYFLLEAPTEIGRDYVAREINQCNADDEKLWDLGQWYIDHLLRLFKHDKEPTPEPSNVELDDSQRGEIVHPPTSHATAKILALHRDAYRCLISGVYDISVDENADEDEHFATTKTRAAHICSHSPNKLEYSKTASAFIKAFGNIDALAELQGNNAHSLSNILTLRSDLHGLFNDLAIWLEQESRVGNTYYVCATRPGILRAIPSRTVIFATKTELPLPDSRYLKLHAAVCRIARLSGAAAYMEDMDCRHEQTGVLAYDGSSADYLTGHLTVMRV